MVVMEVTFLFRESFFCHRKTCYWSIAVPALSRWSTLAVRATLTSVSTRTSSRASTVRPKSSLVCLTVRPSTCGVSVRFVQFYSRLQQSKWCITCWLINKMHLISTTKIEALYNVGNTHHALHISRLSSDGLTNYRRCLLALSLYWLLHTECCMGNVFFARPLYGSIVLTLCTHTYIGYMCAVFYICFFFFCLPCF